MWQQSGSPNYITYADAEKYIRELNDKRFVGHNDWRLPTLEEAMSLMEPTKHDGWHLPPVFHPTQRWIWTADKESSGVAWVVSFYEGHCFNVDAMIYSGAVRAMRVGQSII